MRRAHLCIVLAVAIFLAAVHARAQWSGHDGWIEETNGKTLKDDPGHSYLDPASIHRGDDGLIYFNESSGVTKPDEIGRAGFMKDAYDCSKNIKYMCVGQGDWLNDPKSTINTANDPALQIYRKYLCGDDAGASNPSGADSANTASRNSPQP
jgi:hypothetical protein